MKKVVSQTTQSASSAEGAFANSFSYLCSPPGRQKSKKKKCSVPLFVPAHVFFSHVCVISLSCGVTWHRGCICCRYLSRWSQTRE